MRLGISLHTLTSDISEKGLAFLKGSGVETLEIAQSLFDNENGDVQKKCLKKFLKASGIKAETIHARFGGGHDISSTDPKVRGKAVRSACEAIELAVFFNAHTVVIHASSEPIAEAERTVRLSLAIESLKTIYLKTCELRRRLAIELLPRTCLGNSVEEVLGLISYFDDGTVGVCLDTNHLMSDHSRIPEIVRRLAKRLFTLHLSDYDGIDEKHWLPGNGVVDWAAFMKALDEIGYGGPFNYECVFRPDERVRMISKNYSWLTNAGR